MASQVLTSTQSLSKDEARRDAGQQSLHRQAKCTTVGPVMPDETRERTQQPLEEDEYADGLYHLIMRDFFPDIFAREQKKERLMQWQSLTEDQDPEAFEQFERHFFGSQRHSQTPSMHQAIDTPVASTSRSFPARRGQAKESLEIPDHMSLSDYQSIYTSEDNDCFLQILHKETVQRHRDLAWAYVSARKANIDRLRLMRGGGHEDELTAASESVGHKPTLAITESTDGDDRKRALSTDAAYQPAPLDQAKESEQAKPSPVNKIISLQEVGRKAEKYEPEPEAQGGAMNMRKAHTFTKVRNNLFFPLNSEQSPIFAKPDIQSTLERLKDRQRLGISHKNTRFRVRRAKACPESASSSRIGAALRDELSSIGGEDRDSSQAPSTIGEGESEFGTDVVDSETMLTWGTIDSTPIALNTPHERVYALPVSSKRDQIHRRLASDKGIKQRSRSLARKSCTNSSSQSRTPNFDSYTPRRPATRIQAGAKTPLDRREALTPAARALMARLPGA